MWIVHFFSRCCEPGQSKTSAMWSRLLRSVNWKMTMKDERIMGWNVFRVEMTSRCACCVSCVFLQCGRHNEKRISYGHSMVRGGCFRKQLHIDRSFQQISVKGPIEISKGYLLNPFIPFVNLSTKWKLSYEPLQIEKKEVTNDRIEGSNRLYYRWALKYTRHDHAFSPKIHERINTTVCLLF